MNPVYKELLKMKMECESQLELSKMLGVSATYLSDIFTHRRAISCGFAKRLGFERVVTWRRIR